MRTHPDIGLVIATCVAGAFDGVKGISCYLTFSSPLHLRMFTLSPSKPPENKAPVGDSRLVATCAFLAVYD